jgi:hypothetical protein
VAGCCECGDEPLGSGAKELVICRYTVPEHLSDGIPALLHFHLEHCFTEATSRSPLRRSNLVTSPVMSILFRFLFSQFNPLHSFCFKLNFLSTDTRFESRPDRRLS